jgi:hypothetical protein
VCLVLKVLGLEAEGVHAMTYNSIMKCDVDVRKVRTFYTSVFHLDQSQRPAVRGRCAAFYRLSAARTAAIAASPQRARSD